MYAAPFIAALDHPACFVGSHGRILYANTAMGRLLGHRNGRDLEDRELADLATVDTADKWTELLYCARCGRMADVALRVLVRGQSANTVISLRSLHDEDGHLLGFLGQATEPAARPAAASRQMALADAAYGLWQLNTDDNVLQYSPQWAAMRGVDPAQLPGSKSDLFTAIHPDDRRGVEARLDAFLSGRDAGYQQDYRVIQPNGDTLWILSWAYADRSKENGPPHSITGVDLDITALKSSKSLIDLLVDKELRWRTALTNAGQAVWDHNHATHERYVSPIWRQIRGLQPDAPLHDTFDSWMAQVHPDDRADLARQIEQHNSGKTDTVNHQYRQRHADGHWVWILSRGRVVERDHKGRVLRVIGTDTDITDIKAAETERARLSERLSLAVEAADLAVWDYDIATDSMTWGDRLFAMVGIPLRVGPLRSRDWVHLVHPDDRARITAIGAKAVQQQHPVSTDFRVIRPDGAIIFLRISGHFARQADGRKIFIGICQDLTQDYTRTHELERAQEQLEHDSRHDALTDLGNRRMLDLIKSRHRGGPAAVLHVDLDRFKQLNDTFGHSAGDAVLQHVAQILRKHCPSDGLVTRIGGDEFIILVRSAQTEQSLSALATSLIDDIDTPIGHHGHICRITASIGVASGTFSPDDQGLFDSAGLALHKAKSLGRSRVAFYSPDLSDRAAVRRSIIQCLTMVLERGEITCHYQPQFEAKTLKLVGLEALIRWDHPERGVLMPDSFLPVAEEMGVITQLDQYLLEMAVCDLQHWGDMGIDAPRISVNVSANRLRDPQLCDLLRSMNLPRGRFSFELLESTFLDGNDGVLTRNIEAIKEMGIDIEIDDFGTGHASIISLQQVLPKRLKIDRQLIGPVISSSKQRDLVRTIIEIGRMQDTDIVAEGVETWAHVRALQDLKCDILQGYVLSRPLARDQMVAFFRKLAENGGRITLGRET